MQKDKINFHPPCVFSPGEHSPNNCISAADGSTGAASKGAPHHMPAVGGAAARWLLASVAISVCRATAMSRSGSRRQRLPREGQQWRSPLQAPPLFAGLDYGRLEMQRVGLSSPEIRGRAGRGVGPRQGKRAAAGQAGLQWGGARRYRDAADRARR
jgi:hypothetical protein